MHYILEQCDKPSSCLTVATYKKGKKYHLYRGWVTKQGNTAFGVPRTTEDEKKWLFGDARSTENKKNARSGSPERVKTKKTGRRGATKA